MLCLTPDGPVPRLKGSLLHWMRIVDRMVTG